MTKLLDRSFIFKDFKKTLILTYGQEIANQVWNDANLIFQNDQKIYHNITKDSKMMILPAAALYKALKKYDSKHALDLLKEYGTQKGNEIASIIHCITSIPGLPHLLWKNMPKLMRTMSSAEKGYTRRIVSETHELVGVDILSCPLHQDAIKIGLPEAAQVVCAMDKAYMTGFKHIQYTRSTSVAEGNECCDYRLSYDKSKK